MKTLLFVALEFPPQNNTGTYRSLKFVKNLQYFNVTPIVVTLSELSSKNVFGDNFDSNLLKDLDNIEIHRVPLVKSFKRLINLKIFLYFKLFFSVHDKIVNTWESSARKRLDFLIENRNPDAIFITFPPFSCIRLVNYLKNKYNIAVLIDFRDAWSSWGNTFFPTFLHFKIIQRLEKSVFLKADKIITVTDELKEKFIKIHGESLRSKIFVIPNSFDSDQIVGDIVSNSHLSNYKIRIGYIGSFYFSPILDVESKKVWYKRPFHRWLHFSQNEEDWKYRSPFYFLMTLKHLFSDFPEFRHRVIFEHIGYSPDWLFEMVDDLGLIDNFISHGFKTRSEVLDLANKFDFLLATSEKNLQGPHYCLPSKLFDYIQIGKPILAFVTEGSQRNFLIKSGYPYIFNPDSTSENAMFLARIFSFSINFVLDKNYISSFSSKQTAYSLSNLI